MYQIIRGGCETRHTSSFVMSRPEGLQNYIVLIIHSAGQFHIGDTQYDLIPGHAVVIAPNTPYSYSNPSGDYIDDWLHFDVSDSAYFQNLYPMTNQLIPIGKTEPLTFFIRQILWEASYAPSAYAAENIDSLFTVLINHLLAAYDNRHLFKNVNPYEAQLQALRLELQNTLAEKHSIKEFARNMGVSESYFQHLYTDCFGISFQKDYINLRIEHAKYALSTSTLPIEQIAEICGYANEVHFYRQFKAVTGMTPAKYRKSNAPV